jgi:Flp pilus assembly protein CpaB
VIDDVVEGFEDPVGKPVLPHEHPDVFLAVEFGGARGSGMSEILLGTLRVLAPCQPA